MDGLFMPTGDTVTVTVAATTAAAAIGVTMNEADASVRIAAPSTNAGPVFVKFGPSTQEVTTANGMPILPGTSEAFDTGNNATHIATIGTAADVLYVTPGQGA